MRRDETFLSTVCRFASQALTFTTQPLKHKHLQIYIQTHVVNNLLDIKSALSWFKQQLLPCVYVAKLLVNTVWYNSKHK